MAARRSATMRPRCWSVGAALPLPLLLLNTAALLASLPGRVAAQPASPDAAAAALAASVPAPASCDAATVAKIAFGVGSGAHQFEGLGGGSGGRRAPSVWEPFIAADPGRIADRTDASVGAGFYARWRDDVALLRALKVKHFRLSISWPRLLPAARAGAAPPPDAAAAAFYSDLIDALLAAGIEPIVAIYHWDLPQSLQDAYGGFASPSIVPDYLHFAETAFKLLAPRVKTWLTFIEPNVICNQQYGNAQFAPGVALGDQGRYACGHNVLRAHAAAAARFRERYAKSSGGRIGFTSLLTWAEPASARAADIAAAQNKLDAEAGWFLDPVFKGDYPASLRAAKGAALPRFTAAEAAALKGSVDFIAANTFTARWASAPGGGGEARGAWREAKANPYNGTLVGAASGVSWIDVAPWAQGRALRYLKARYGNPAIIISSSGVMGPGEARAAGGERLRDGFRLDYYKAYLGEVCGALKDGVRVAAWLAWSFLDAWEWREGYTQKFGIVHVDYGSGGRGGSLARSPKASALWLSKHFFEGGAAAVPYGR